MEIWFLIFLLLAECLASLYKDPQGSAPSVIKILRLTNYHPSNNPDIDWVKEIYDPIDQLIRYESRPSIRRDLDYTNLYLSRFRLFFPAASILPINMAFSSAKSIEITDTPLEPDSYVKPGDVLCRYKKDDKYTESELQSPVEGLLWSISETSLDAGRIWTLAHILTLGEEPKDASPKAILWAEAVTKLISFRGAGPSIYIEP